MAQLAKDVLGVVKFTVLADRVLHGYTSLMLSSGGLTSRLQRLKSKGLIKRKSSNTDGRSQLVVLTKRGLLLTDKVFEQDMEVENMLLSGMNNKDLDTLTKLLRKLYQSIDRLGSSPNR